MYSRSMLPESSSRNMTFGLIDEVAVPRGSVASVRAPDSTAELKPSAPATESDQAGELRGAAVGEVHGGLLTDQFRIAWT